MDTYNNNTPLREINEKTKPPIIQNIHTTNAVFDTDNTPEEFLMLDDNDIPLEQLHIELVPRHEVRQDIATWTPAGELSETVWHHRSRASRCDCFGCVAIKAGILRAKRKASTTKSNTE